MSIKPVAMIPENELKHIEDRRTALVVPVCEEWSDRVCVMLYAIPDTHRVVPVEPTREMCKAATSYTHSHDAKLIYKAMLAAAKEKGE